MKNIVVPNGVKIIAERAFCNCSTIECLILPESVKQIERYAFAYCKNLEKIEANENLAVVEEDAFEYVPDRAFNYYEGGMYLGNEKHPYHCFVRPAATAKRIRIHEGCKIMTDSAFPYGDRFEEVVVPRAFIATHQAINTDKLVISESVTNPLDLLTFDYSTEVIVLSDETNEVKTVIPAYSDKTYGFDKMLRECWNENNIFNFEVFDSYFENIHGDITKLKVALTRIRYPYDLKDEAEKIYGAFISSKSKQVISQCIEENDMELLHLMTSNNLISKRAIKPLIALATEKGKTTITAALLEYNNRNFQ